MVKWTLGRRQKWSEHIEEMNSQRIAKIIQSQKPNSTRPMGRLPKRWKDSWISLRKEEDDCNHSIVFIEYIFLLFG